MKDIHRQSKPREAPRKERPLRPYFADCAPVCAICAADSHATPACPLAPWNLRVPLDTHALAA